MKNTKEFKTIDAQIQGLKNRNLQFKSLEKSKDFLLKYNYFDVVNGFESILLDKKPGPKNYSNVYFEDFMDLYCFDMSLKENTLLLIFDFESRLRTSIAYHFAQLNCASISTTMNYTNPAYFKKPNPKDVHLSNCFKDFDLFKKAQYDKSGKKVQDSFIDSIKKHPYVKEYSNPPFWVVIKTIPLGTLRYLFTFLQDDVKSLVLADFGLKLSDEDVFIQALYVIKEMRNQCAHLELVSRFRLHRSNNLNGFADITTYASLSKMELNYLDVLKILRLFLDVSRIKKCIFTFYFKMLLKGRLKIATKALSMMGRKNIKTWLFI